jgi:hypothetical protein
MLLSYVINKTDGQAASGGRDPGHLRDLHRAISLMNRPSANTAAGTQDVSRHKCMGRGAIVQICSHKKLRKTIAQAHGECIKACTPTASVEREHYLKHRMGAVRRIDRRRLCSSGIISAMHGTSRSAAHSLPILLRRHIGV